MLTLLTTTGERPLAWKLCQQHMARQTYAGAVRWIIVDDGQVAQSIEFERENWTLEVIRPTPYWTKGTNTQSRNLLAGLEVVSSNDLVAIIEDDDWYSPHWLRAIDEMRGAAEVVGERRAFYYNLPSRAWREMKNSAHASLCSTAITGSAIETLKTICHQTPRFIDLVLWRLHPSKRLFDSQHVVGIKGLPGRPGIGTGHQASHGFRTDPSGEVLRNRIGSDADFYLNLQLETE